MEHPTPRGVLDRSDPGIGGEAVPVGKAVDVAAVADQRAGEDRAHAEQIGERGLRRPHGGADATMRLFDLLVEARHVSDELEREFVAHVLDGGGRLKEPSSRLASET